MFLNSAVAVGGIWLVLGLRSGIWSPGFLATILILTFFFAILYAVSAFFAVLTLQRHRLHPGHVSRVVRLLVGRLGLRRTGRGPQ